MKRRVAGAILLLYPRRVRRRHGAEIVALIDDLIARDGRARAGLFLRLAVDGVVQRAATTTAAWTVAAVLAATGLTGLAASDFAAASADRGTPSTLHTVSPPRHTAIGHMPHRDRSTSHADPARRSGGASSHRFSRPGCPLRRAVRHWRQSGDLHPRGGMAHQRSARDKVSAVRPRRTSVAM